MAKRFRSSRRFPDPNNVLTEGVQLDYLNDLLRSLYDLETDVPYLPISKTPFVTETTQELYSVSAGSTTTELANVLGTLLTKLRDSGIIL